MAGLIYWPKSKLYGGGAGDTAGGGRDRVVDRLVANYGAFLSTLSIEVRP